MLVSRGQKAQRNVLLVGTAGCPQSGNGVPAPARVGVPCIAATSTATESATRCAMSTQITTNLLQKNVVSTTVQKKRSFGLFQAGQGVPRRVEEEGRHERSRASILANNRKRLGVI